MCAGAQLQLGYVVLRRIGRFETSPVLPRILLRVLASIHPGDPLVPFSDRFAVFASRFFNFVSELVSRIDAINPIVVRYCDLVYGSETLNYSRHRVFR